MTTLAPAATDFARATIEADRPAPAADAALWQEHGFALPGQVVLAIVATVVALSLLLG